MTEVSGGFTGHQGDDYEIHPASCGPPFPIGEMKIVDANGNTMPPGGVGELMVKGPSVVRGYWQDPQATAICSSMAGCAPAISPVSTPRVSVTSSIAPRTC